MGLDYGYPSKKIDSYSDRGAHYGAWMSNRQGGRPQRPDWKTTEGAKKPDPWGPIFKNKQKFIDMHFC